MPTPILTSLWLIAALVVPALGQSTPASSPPERFQFLQGHAYMGSDSLTWENGKLISTKRYSRLDGKSGFREVVKQFEPSPHAWARFWKAVDTAGVWKWQNHYSSPMSAAQDGEAWKLELSHTGRSLKSQGYNAWPVQFDDFRKALEQLMEDGKKETNAK